MKFPKKRKELIANWYEQYSKSILSYILLMVRDYQYAEDLTHDTFIKGYLYYDSFNYQSAEKTWLFSIAHNVTIDFLRKHKSRQFLNEAMIFKEENMPLPEDIIQIKEESLELYKASLALSISLPNVGLYE